jgi:hypothetical protein
MDQPRLAPHAGQLAAAKQQSCNAPHMGGNTAAFGLQIRTRTDHFSRFGPANLLALIKAQPWRDVFFYNNISVV